VQQIRLIGLRCRGIQLLVLAMGCVLLAGACFRGDWWMYVTNDTDRVLFVRVQRGPTEADRYSVARVEPGADGPAVTWLGEATVPVEVLDESCQLIGVFTGDGGTSFVLPEMPGVTGHIEPWRLVGGNQSPGITDTEECG
jgi:hypothetical protein